MNLKGRHRSVWALLAIFLLCCSEGMADIILFSADMQAATVEADTGAANLNAGTTTGTWTDSAGRSPSDIDIVEDAGGNRAVRAGRDDNGPPWDPFDLTANFVSSASLLDTAVIELDVQIQSQIGDHWRDIHIVGLDGSNNESFHLQLSANNVTVGALLRVGYIHSGGTGPVWDLPGTAVDADNDLIQNWTFASSRLRGLKLHMSGSQYRISLDKDNDGVYDEAGEWTTDWLDFNGSATTISKIRIYGESSNSGFFFDNVEARIVTGAPTVDTASGATALDAVSATLEGSLVSTNGLALQAVRIYLGNEDGGETYNWDTNYVFDPVAISAGDTFSTNVTGLIYGVEYSYRVYASNSAGEVWSDVETFTTLEPQSAALIGNSGISILRESRVGTEDASWGTATNAINGNGLSGDNHTDNDWTKQWASWKHGDDTDSQAYMVVDLGDVYSLRSLKIWNCRDTGTGLNTGGEAKDVQIRGTADSGIKDTGQTDVASESTWDDWTTLKDVTLSQGVNPGQEVVFDSAYEVQWVSFDIDTLYENENPTGLSEVQFYTAVSAISITNTAAEAIGVTNAYLRGEFAATQSVFTVSLYWGTNDKTGDAWLSDGTASNLVVGTYTNGVGLSFSNNIEFLSGGTTYYCTYVATNAATNLWPTSNQSFTTYTLDSDAPVQVALSPANAATDVPLAAVFTISFDEPIFLMDDGIVTITNITDGTSTNLIVPDARVSISSSTNLLIDPPATLGEDDNVAVLIATNTIRDFSSNVFTGITSTATWNFTMTSPLVAPTFTSATSLDWSTVSLAWQDNETRESHYILRRSPSGNEGTYSVIATLAANVTSYMDEGLAPSTTYYYQLAASNAVDGRVTAFTACETNAVTSAFNSESRILSASHVVSGSVAGRLIAIDVPYVGSGDVSGGPIWTSDPDWGATASPEDNGFVTVNNQIKTQDGTSNWEPDGTPLAEAKGYFTHPSSTAPSVKYVFNLASAWIDIPDGSVIHAVYTTWNTRNNDGCTYAYTEGSQSGSIVRQTTNAAPVADLVLRWTDADSNTHDANFERIFSGPIVVEGDDGFEVWATDNINNSAHLDAVVIDISFVRGGSVFRFR